jgi:hypothetical protein
MATADTQPRTFPERDEWLRTVLASDLPHVAARVACVIGLHLNVRSGRCDPGIDDIIAASKVSERSIYRKIVLLERAGWIAIRRIRGPGRHNEYFLVYPDRAVAGLGAGLDPALPCHSSVSVTLPKHPLRPATTVAGQDKRQAKRQGAGAKTPAPRERERRELALAVIPGALAPVSSAPKEGKEVAVDRFSDLLAVWQRPWGENEAAARVAFAKACREADPDAIIASARAWVAAKEPDRHLQPLEKWLARGAWKNQPPSPKQKRNGGKVSLSNIALAISRDGGDQS